MPEGKSIDIFSDEFLERVSALEQRNLALETLRKLLNDQIKTSERTNLVQAQKFREALERAMLGYTNKQITTAQMIAQLLELARWVREAKRHGTELGLSDEETALTPSLPLSRVSPAHSLVHLAPSPSGSILRRACGKRICQGNHEVR